MSSAVKTRLVAWRVVLISFFAPVSVFAVCVLLSLIELLLSFFSFELLDGKEQIAEQMSVHFTSRPNCPIHAEAGQSWHRPTLPDQT